MMPGLGEGLFILIRWLFAAISVGLIAICVFYFFFQKIRLQIGVGSRASENAGGAPVKSFIRRRYKTILLIAVLIFVAQYWVASRHRVSASACEQEENRDHKYIGEICLLPYEDGAIFRLYDANTKEILAEREYYDLSPKLLFGSDRVYYSMDASKENAYVLLPPSWIDRLMAKLP